MLTWRIFRGISCLWTNARHSRCIGIRPSGLGLRLRLLQYADPNPCVLALAGERSPFSFGAPLGVLTSSGFRLVGLFTVIVLAALELMPPFIVILVGFRSICGLRLRLRARESSGSSSCVSPVACSSIASTELKRCVFDLVAGGKYPSFVLLSDGVGEGDMTRGVLGI